MKAKPINSTDEFFKKLSNEGKVTILNKPEHIKAINKVNKAMKETKIISRDMQIKSEESAKKFII